MASLHHSQNQSLSDPTTKNTEDPDAFTQTHQKIKAIIPTLPKHKGWITEHLLNYKSTWLSLSALKGLILVQHHFKSQPNDILLSTFPKSGTTWFKSLIFTITNRSFLSFSTHPLLNTNPHNCIPFIEAIISQNDHNPNPKPPSPRLLATHIPYPLLPPSITSYPSFEISKEGLIVSNCAPNGYESGCRIVYVFRNPKDVFVSTWHYMKKLRLKELPPLELEEAFEMFCEGVSHFGPFWDHVLGYWKASLELPEKVLFLTYEDMKRDPLICVKKLAVFLGKPFSLEEERDGVVEEIIRLCSFENLSNLEVNKTGVQEFSPEFAVENRYFSRKGEVGDWKNHLTSEMAERIDQITRQKFNGTSLMLHI